MFSFATASTLTMSEDNFWRENHNLPIGWMKTLSTKKLDAQGNYTAPNSKVGQKRDWLLYTLLSSPEGTIFRSRIQYVEVVEHKWSAGRAPDVEDHSSARKRTISQVFYIIFTVFGSTRSSEGRH